MQYIQDITLDIYGTALYHVTSKQYDNAARYIRVQLTENGTPIKVSRDLEAHIRALKPDGHSVDNAAEILEDGRVQAELTEQILACEGVTLADIVILDGDTVLSSADFRIDCGKAPVGKNVESKDEFLVLVEATKNAREATEAANKAAENVKSTDNSIKEAEEARVKAEAERVTAEEARVEAERARADEHTQAMEDVDTAVQAAGKATADAQEIADNPPIIRGGNWWTWDKDADIYVDTGKRAVLGIDVTYPSIADMEADSGSQKDGTIAIIQSNVDDADNARLYRYNGTDWVYLSDLSGFTGPQGPQGDAWVPSVDEDGNLTWEKNGETDPAPANIRGPIGPAGPEGPQGPPGKDGTGTGDMEKAVYDPDSRNTDIFGYVDEAVKNVRIDMDDVPTEGSQNAVKSGGVYTALAGKQDKLTFDDVPTENSANPVKSGGVYDALQRKSNPNLLDNWYFIGGGSQQGSGQFPINQRGQTEYKGLGYSVDRWYINDGNQKTLPVTVDANGLVLSAALSWMRFEQRIEKPTRLNGHTLTFSILVKNPHSTVRAVIRNKTNSTMKYEGISAQNGVGLCSVTVDSDILQIEETNQVIVAIYPNVDEVLEAKVTLIAAKLEFGSQQTLAHKEGDIWVLNDPPPNYQQELAKCQRYQISLDSIFPNSSYIGPFTVGTPPTDSSQGHMYAYVPLPVGMRARPSITVKDASKIGHWNPGGYAVSVESFTFVGGDNKGISICANISPTSTVLPKGFAGFLYTTKSSPAGIMLDANL